MTFLDYRQEVYKAHVLDTTKFGETIRFFPKGKPERSIVANVQVEGETRERSDNRIDQVVERLRVSVLTDESDTDKGGVADFVPGDSLFRAGQKDELRYAWDGEVPERTEHSITGIFLRHRTLFIGTAAKA